MRSRWARLGIATMEVPELIHSGRPLGFRWEQEARLLRQVVPVVRAMAVGLVGLACTGNILPAHETGVGSGGGGAGRSGVGGSGVVGTGGAGGGQGTGSPPAVVARPGLSARLSKVEYEN